MSNLNGVLHELTQERKRMEEQVEALRAAENALLGINGNRPAKRHMSTAARARIAAAQRARWAKYKRERA